MAKIVRRGWRWVGKFSKIARSGPRGVLNPPRVSEGEQLRPRNLSSFSHSMMSVTQRNQILFVERSTLVLFYWNDVMHGQVRGVEVFERSVFARSTNATQIPVAVADAGGKILPTVRTMNLVGVGRLVPRLLRSLSAVELRIVNSPTVLTTFKHRDTPLLSSRFRVVVADFVRPCCFVFIFQRERLSFVRISKSLTLSPSVARPSSAVRRPSWLVVCLVRFHMRNNNDEATGARLGNPAVRSQYVKRIETCSSSPSSSSNEETSSPVVSSRRINLPSFETVSRV